MGAVTPGSGARSPDRRERPGAGFLVEPRRVHELPVHHPTGRIPSAMPWRLHSSSSFTPPTARASRL